MPFGEMTITPDDLWSFLAILVIGKVISMSVEKLSNKDAVNLEVT